MSERTAGVVVVGAGPTGLVLAAELALAGVDVAVLERRATPELAGSRAGGFHARTIEILDQRGIAERFLSEGQTVQVLRFGDTALDLGGLPTRHPYTLGLWQQHIERLLLGWTEELGVPVHRGVEVTGLVQDGTGVDVLVGGGDPWRAAYLVGADGGRSVVRRAAGIAFPGPDASRSQLIAEVELTEEPPSGIRLDEIGIHAMNRLEDGRTVRMVVTERRLEAGAEPGLADLRAALREAFGTDLGVHSPTWISRFTDATRQAEHYRRGRVLVAGDAAHVHHPAGGQGIGLGIQDAVNLGWKLAQVVRGVSPATLLDSYGAERGPATSRTLEQTMVQAQVQRSEARVDAVRATIERMLVFDGPRTQLAALLAGLDVAHHPDEGHPLLGRRVPDLDLTTPAGPRRVHALLHDARPVLLDLGGAGELDPGAWAGRVRHVRAGCTATWELPVLGAVPAPGAVLVRPDGHVAWVGEGAASGLTDALAHWFGPAR